MHRHVINVWYSWKQVCYWRITILEITCYEVNILPTQTTQGTTQKRPWWAGLHIQLELSGPRLFFFHVRLYVNHYWRTLPNYSLIVYCSSLVEINDFNWLRNLPLGNLGPPGPRNVDAGRKLMLQCRQQTYPAFW